MAAQIEAATKTPIRLDALTIEPSVQPRVAGLVADHVAALMACQEELPPIVVARQRGRLIPCDGLHRIASAQNLGLEEILAVVIDVPDDFDLRDLSFELNASHGLAFTMADRRAEAARLLRRDPSRADREIGRRAGITQPTVARIRSDLERSGTIEQTETRVGRGGYTYAVHPRDGAEADSGEQAEGRRLALFLARLAVSLERLNDHPGWPDNEGTLEALLEAFEEEDAYEILASFGSFGGELVGLATAAGWEPE
jgi:DNA-binding Lrp family transcriptional regulator